MVKRGWKISFLIMNETVEYIKRVEERVISMGMGTIVLSKGEKMYGKKIKQNKINKEVFWRYH